MNKPQPALPAIMHGCPLNRPKAPKWEDVKELDMAFVPPSMLVLWTSPDCTYFGTRIAEIGNSFAAKR